jgi:type IV secretory pathway VirB2 component (pilin)
MLIAQSWTIHHDRRSLHRSMGTMSLLLFPLFLAGGSTIFLGMAQRYVQGSPFHVMYGPNLAWLDFVSIGGVAYLYYEALRQRRKVHAHSRYMLATIIFLLPPIFGRLSAIPLGVRGPEDFHRLGMGFQVTNVLIALGAFWLAYHSRRHGRPFAVAGALTLLAAFLFQFVGPMPAWRAMLSRAAEIPTAPFALSAGLAGVVVAYAGWVGGRRPAIGSGMAPA